MMVLVAFQISISKSCSKINIAPHKDWPTFSCGVCTLWKYTTKQLTPISKHLCAWPFKEKIVKNAGPVFT